MQYIALLYVPTEIEADRGEPEWDASLPYHRAVGEKLRGQGIEVTGGALRDVRTATSVRVRGGHRLVTDGPFAETKEQLWGYLVVDAPDLDTVLDACSGLWEAEHGTVEVRPLIPLG